MPQENFIESHVLDEDILVLRLHGKLDVTTTPEFRAVVQHHFDEGKRRVIIDCARLGYISSVGIGALVSTQTTLKKQGGEVKLAGVQGAAAEVIKIVGLDKLMGIYGDAEFARQSFSE